MRHTYGRLLGRLNRHGTAKGALLEIGCTNGFFLEEALAEGWRDVRGVEPGGETIARRVLLTGGSARRQMPEEITGSSLRC